MKTQLTAMLLGAVLWLFLAYFAANNTVSWQCQETSSFRGENGQYCTLSINQEHEGAIFVNILVTETVLSISQGFEG